jgi:hypothetical protein
MFSWVDRVNFAPFPFIIFTFQFVVLNYRWLFLPLFCFIFGLGQCCPLKGNYFLSHPLNGAMFQLARVLLLISSRLRLVLPVILQTYESLTSHQFYSILSDASAMVYQLLSLTPQIIHATTDGTLWFHTHGAMFSWSSLFTSIAMLWFHVWFLA